MIQGPGESGDDRLDRADWHVASLVLLLLCLGCVTILAGKSRLERKRRSDKSGLEKEKMEDALAKASSKSNLVIAPSVTCEESDGASCMTKCMTCEGSLYLPKQCGSDGSDFGDVLLCRDRALFKKVCSLEMEVLPRESIWDHIPMLDGNKPRLDGNKPRNWTMKAGDKPRGWRFQAITKHKPRGWKFKEKQHPDGRFKRVKARQAHVWLDWSWWMAASMLTMIGSALQLY